MTDVDNAARQVRLREAIRIASEDLDRVQPRAEAALAVVSDGPVAWLNAGMWDHGSWETPPLDETFADLGHEDLQQKLREVERLTDEARRMAMLLSTRFADVPRPLADGDDPATTLAELVERIVECRSMLADVAASLDA